MSIEFLLVYNLVAKIIPGLALCVNTLLGSGSLTIRVVNSVDVVVENVHVPIDMLILPMSDCDIVLGMNWLNHYTVTINCRGVTLSFMVGDQSFGSKLVRLEPM